MKVCVTCLERANESGSPNPLFQVVLSCDVADVYFGQITELEGSKSNLAARVGSPILIVG